MAIDTIKTSAILDGSVTSADLDTNINVSGTLSVGDNSSFTPNTSASELIVGETTSGVKSGITILSSNDVAYSRGSIYFADADADASGRIEYNHGTGAQDALRIFTGGANERLRIDSDGLKFNGDTAAANALNDYEEGTFTATVHDALSGGNAASYSTAGGYYTKIGNMVFAHFDVIDINTAGLTNQAVLTFNLPFTAGVTTTLSQNWAMNEVDLDANGARPYVFQCLTGWVRGRFIYSRDNTTAEYLRENMVEDGIADIRLSFTYWTS